MREMAWTTHLNSYRKRPRLDPANALEVEMSEEQEEGNE